MKRGNSRTTIVIFIALTLVLFGAVYFLYILQPSLDTYYKAVRTNDSAKLRLHTMESLDKTVKEMQSAATKAQEESLDLKGDYRTYDAVEDIEGDFTRAMLLRNLAPISVRITPEIGDVGDPFDKFTVNAQAAGTLEEVYTLCDFVNDVDAAKDEISYRLSDMQISEDRSGGGYVIAINVSVIYVKK